MKTVELSFHENLLCLLLGSSSLVSGLFIKLVLPYNLIISRYGVEFGDYKKYWAEIPDPKEEALKAEREQK